MAAIPVIEPVKSAEELSEKEQVVSGLDDLFKTDIK